MNMLELGTAVSTIFATLELEPSIFDGWFYVNLFQIGSGLLRVGLGLI